MNGNLKTKLANLSKNNKSPLAKYFQDPEYVQDKEGRRAQILFYKLLMVTAYADESIDEAEIDLIKDYTYEQCLTEQEWREIDFFRRIKPTQQEIEEMLNRIVNEVRSVSEKKELLNAIKELVQADEILQEEEKEIYDLLEQKLKSVNMLTSVNLFSRIKRKIKENLPINESAAEYTKNPISPILKRLIGEENLPDIEIIAAKLGLAIIMIHSDMEFHENEKKAFEDLVKEECNLNEDKAKEIASQLIEIPDNYFELSYLSRLITDSVNEEERKNVLLSLFKIARADQVYSTYEDKYLKIISNYLLIEHKDFISLKLMKDG